MEVIGLILLYLLIGAIFSGVTNRTDLWHTWDGWGGGERIIGPIITWPILLPVILFCLIFYPFVMIAESIGRKKEVSGEVYE
jgi:hypothetical protein